MSPFLFFLGLGVALILIEILVLGVSAFWFLFVGFGALIAALYTYVTGDSSWIVSSGIFVLASLAICLGFYRPLKKWQTTKNALPGNDAIGQAVDVISWDEDNQSGKVMWSGTEWFAKADNTSDKLSAGDSMKISAISGIHLQVEKA